MKAIQQTDGRVEFDGTPEEMARLFRGPVAMPTPPKVVIPAPTHKPAKADAFRAAGERVPGSVPSRFIELLTKNPERAFKTAEVADALGITNKVEGRNLNSALNRIAKEPGSPIKNVGRGLYQASTKGAA